MPYMYALYVCLLCMPYMSPYIAALCLCLAWLRRWCTLQPLISRKVAYMYALYVCLTCRLICMPCMHVCDQSQGRPPCLVFIDRPVPAGPSAAVFCVCLCPAPPVSSLHKAASNRLYGGCVCLICMYALYVCLICMPYRVHVYRMCMPYMYALYVCLICMPYVHG
jgi:hypothetical protein